MQLTFTSTLAELDPRIDAFLAQRLERNILAAVLAQLREGRSAEPAPRFAWGTERSGAICFFAMRTPPWPLLVTELQAHDARPLLERWLAEDPQLPGVSGEPAAAQALARAWQRCTHGRWTRRMELAQHVLEEVSDPPRRPPGLLRTAGAADRELLITWERRFIADAHAFPGAAAEAERTVALRLARRSQHIWQDRGPVSTLAVSPPIFGTVRIGPVYTPPQHRRRGYATAAVASAARMALDAGATRCVLFTDLANPTSNRIYASVGFRRFAGWEELDLL